MTQDVLAPHATGGAHLHDPDGPAVLAETDSPEVSAPAAARFVAPAADMGDGVPARRDPTVLTEVERAAARFAAVHPSQEFPAVQPRYVPGVQPSTDPDATVVIGRHRADGTRSHRDEFHPEVPQRWMGRVAAAVVARWRRRGAGR